MNKKLTIQLFFLFLILLISAVGFYLYFYKPQKEFRASKDKIDENVTIAENKVEKSSNIIENLEYISSDEEGNQYRVKSKTGTISIENPDIIYMNNVSAIIILTNSSPVEITSDYAEYNNKNYNTLFSKNVLLTYQEHKAKGGILNLLFADNIATMKENIIYTNKNTKIMADVLEVDLITKDSKIFMNDNSKRIKISRKHGNN